MILKYTQIQSCIFGTWAVNIVEWRHLAECILEQIPFISSIASISDDENRSKYSLKYYGSLEGTVPWFSRSWLEQTFQRTLTSSVQNQLKTKKESHLGKRIQAAPKITRQRHIFTCALATENNRGLFCSQSTSIWNFYTRVAAYFSCCLCTPQLFSCLFSGDSLIKTANVTVFKLGNLKDSHNRSLHFVNMLYSFFTYFSRLND